MDSYDSFEHISLNFAHEIIEAFFFDPKLLFEGLVLLLYILLHTHV